MPRSPLDDLFAPFGPLRPVDDLVRELNRIYHAAEAASYDTTHPEIFEQLPALWQRMIDRVVLPGGPLTVVDYGCGTGFAASQLVARLAPGRIGQLICFDPSPEMLARCKDRLHGAAVPVRFCTTIDEWRDEAIDILVTNSVLHHLPDPLAVARALRRQIRPTGVWLAGHEPSVRFYRNAACLAVWHRFERHRKLRTLLSPRRLWAIGQQRLGVATDPASVTARDVATRGWFRRAPDARAIDRIVDLHVAHDPGEVAAGRGLDVDRIAAELHDSWDLQWSTSYSFLGATRERDAPPAWQRAAAELARTYPNDGASFCAIWVPR